MMRIMLLIVIGLSLGFTARGQDSRNPAGKKKTEIKDPTYQQWAAVRKAFYEHPYNKYYDRLVKEYHKRMEANARKYKALAKELEKPQYSDPSYFGHKRKPKKRPVGKRKYCKECGIVH